MDGTMVIFAIGLIFVICATRILFGVILGIVTYKETDGDMALAWLFDIFITTSIFVGIYMYEKGYFVGQ